MNESLNIAVKVQNLTKLFGKFVAVDEINFEVKKGEIFGFLGPNGAGKSTTIRMLCGLLKPTSGRAVVAGYELQTQSDKIKQNIGYMSQKFSLYDDLTVEENINFYGGIYGLQNNELAERKSWILKMAGLVGKEKRLTRELAGGWKQRLALGCAILHNPQIIFLDEPTAGVDPISRRYFWELIYHFAETGATVFVTTHYLDEAEYCNRVGMIFQGKIKVIGTPSELKNRLNIFDIYEIRCNRCVDAMTLLQSEPWVKETSIFGTSFHASISGVEDGEIKIQNILTANRINVDRIDRIIPSLEDVFIHFTSEESNVV